MAQSNKSSPAITPTNSNRADTVTEVVYLNCEGAEKGLALNVDKKSGKVIKFEGESPARGQIFVNDIMVSVNKVRIVDGWEGFEKEMSKKITATTGGSAAGGSAADVVSTPKTHTVELIRGNRDFPAGIERQIVKRVGFDYYFIEINAKKERERQLGIAMIKKDAYVLVSNLAKGGLGSDKLKIHDRILAVNGNFVIRSEHEAKQLVKSSKHGIFQLVVERPIGHTAIRDFTTKHTSSGDDSILPKDVLDMVSKYFSNKPFGTPMGPPSPSILKKSKQMLPVAPSVSMAAKEEPTSGRGGATSARSMAGLSFHGTTSFANKSPHINADKAMTKYPGSNAPTDSPTPSPSTSSAGAEKPPTGKANTNSGDKPQTSPTTSSSPTAAPSSPGGEKPGTKTA